MKIGIAGAVSSLSELSLVERKRYGGERHVRNDMASVIEIASTIAKVNSQAYQSNQVF